MEDNRGNSFDAQGQNKFSNDNAGNYSPSTSFNYTNGKNSTSAGPSSVNRGRTQQHPKRRGDRFKRETINQSDKLVKQNDAIIKLLKEIRDRLPEPPKATKKAKPQRKQSIYRFDENDATQKDAPNQDDIAVKEDSVNESVEDQTTLDLEVPEVSETSEGTEETKE